VFGLRRGGGITLMFQNFAQLYSPVVLRLRRCWRWRRWWQCHFSCWMRRWQCQFSCASLTLGYTL
jgi:hypothetical protein